jgi:micrococcal nuclease
MKFLLIVFVLLSNLVYSQRYGTVKYVYDGDSYGIVIGGILTKVRLINADCPEIANKYTKKEAQPYGDVAKKAVNQYLDKQRVKVKLYGNDKYGRTLAEVWLNENGKNRSLSYALIKGGLAWVNTEYIQNDSLKRILMSKQKHAQRYKIGLWADSTAIEPKEWRR